MTVAWWTVLTVELVAVGLLLVRLAVGPSVYDRVVALNAIATQTTLALFVYTLLAQRTIYLDVALWMSSFSYLGTFVWSRLAERALL